MATCFARSFASCAIFLLFPLFVQAQVSSAVVLDERALRERVDNDEDLLREIAGLFQEDQQELLLKIHGAIEQQNCSALETAAHTLKGALSVFGAKAAANTALRLETLGREQRVQDAPAVYEELKRDIERLLPVLAALKAHA